MNNRINISSGAIWEDLHGYSRAVRIGNLVEVSGTTAVDADGKVVGGDDHYKQTRFILSKIEQALQETGTSLGDVIRTRIFTTDLSNWKEITRAHAEVFGQIKPASTLVEVSALIDPKLLVEIEVTAIVGEILTT